jgi:hypothetical protein
VSGTKPDALVTPVPAKPPTATTGFSFNVAPQSTSATSGFNITAPVPVTQPKIDKPQEGKSQGVTIGGPKEIKTEEDSTKLVKQPSIIPVEAAINTIVKQDISKARTGTQVSILMAYFCRRRFKESV